MKVCCTWISIRIVYQSMPLAGKCCCYCGKQLQEAFEKAQAIQASLVCWVEKLSCSLSVPILLAPSHCKIRLRDEMCSYFYQV